MRAYLRCSVLFNSSKSSSLAFNKSVSALVAKVCLCVCSRSRMRVDNSSIRALLVLDLLAAREIRSPLITHLCAAHSVAGEESGEVFFLEIL